jgi:glycosyltransferase involved in cell wall biosynthesis|tara:strand:+ start:34590 stop:35396 length:807 start_codon:yes stop_codon:yes gene_type:complete
MKLSLVISYYKNLENLELIFKGLEVQSEKDFEVIVAEDDCSQKTIDYLKKRMENTFFSIQHIAQDRDDGFRKNEMLNRAIKISKSEALVFIDGDCIPHRHFVKEYLKAITKGKILFGKRVNLGPTISGEILDEKSIQKINIVNILRSDSDKKKEGIYFPFMSLKIKDTGLLGCNWGILKEYLVAINGYDEDYTAPGVGEDVDIEWRLKATGLKMVSMKNKGIVYHIYHPKGYTDATVQANYLVLEEKQKIGNIQCVNGLNKLQPIQRQ